MSNPIVIEIVKTALKEKGFDGLFNPDSECACGLNDLAPCCEMSMDCEAGYEVKELPDGCFNNGDACDFYIIREKPKDKNNE